MSMHYLPHKSDIPEVKICIPCDLLIGIRDWGCVDIPSVIYGRKVKIRFFKSATKSFFNNFYSKNPMVSLCEGDIDYILEGGTLQREINELRNSGSFEVEENEFGYTVKYDNDVHIKLKILCNSGPDHPEELVL